MKKTLEHTFKILLSSLRFFYNVYIVVMLVLLLAALSLSLILYLDLPMYLFSTPFHMLSIILIAITFTQFLQNIFCPKIKHSYQNLKGIVPDLILIVFAFVSYAFFILQFFYYNYFNLIQIPTDSTAHRLISHELFLNLDNGPKLVIRNLLTGDISFTDIFYPLGFHSIIFYLSDLFLISVDLTIYIFFSIAWITVIPFTILFLAITMTNSFRISLIFFVIFLNSSEILLQYYYLGLWPFLFGAIMSLFVVLICLPLNIKRTLFMTPLFLGLFSVYPSYAVVSFLIILSLKFPFTQLSQLLKKLSLKIYLYIITAFLFLVILIYLLNLDVNLAIVVDSTSKTDFAYDLSKFLDLKAYLNNIQRRFFDFNSSRFFISFSAIFSIMLYVLLRDFRNFIPKKFFFLYIIFAYSLIIQLISGIIGKVNLFVNPLGLLFYYDFNRIYFIYLIFAILFISYAFYYVIYISKKESFLFVLILALSFLQVNSSFTSRLNSDEILFFDYIKTSSRLNIKFLDDESLLIDCNFFDQDPTFVCFTYRGLMPHYFTNETTIISR